MKYHPFSTTEMMQLFAKSASIRALVDWLYSFYRNFYLMGALLDVLVAKAFTVFAILHSYRENDPTVPVNRLTVMALIVVSCFANLLGIFCSFSVLRYGSHVTDPHPSVPLMFVSRFTMLIIDVVLFAYAYIAGNHSAYSAFTASVGCILCWVVVGFIQKSYSLSQCHVCLWISSFEPFDHSVDWDTLFQ